MKIGQQLQGRMSELKENLESKSISASSGGGMVTVEVDGRVRFKVQMIRRAWILVM